MSATTEGSAVAVMKRLPAGVRIAVTTAERSSSGEKSARPIAFAPSRHARPSAAWRANALSSPSSRTRHASGVARARAACGNSPIRPPVTTPRPYPTAAETPLTSPWTNQSRGSSDGVSDSQKNSTATMTPAKLQSQPPASRGHERDGNRATNPASGGWSARRSRARPSVVAVACAPCARCAPRDRTAPPASSHAPGVPVAFAYRRWGTGVTTTGSRRTAPE